MWNNSRIYDWGIFSYSGDNFLLDWIKNKVRYKCSAYYPEESIKLYIEEDRDIILYTLDLDPKEKEIIINYADNNVLPKNCYYTYHPFKENCSTSIRNLIDIGTKGQLKKYFDNIPGRFTIRGHLSRFTWFRPFQDSFFSFLLGQDSDNKITVWEEMFLPVEIGKNIVGFKYIDNYGIERNLVSEVEIINTTKNRKPIVDKPLSKWPKTLFFTLIITVVLIIINLMRKNNSAICVKLWGVSQILLGLLFGISGAILFFLSFILGHDYFSHNYNLLLVNPLLLIAIPLGISIIIGKYKYEKYLRLLWRYIFITDIVLIILRFFSVIYQNNIDIQLIMLPISFLSGWDFKKNIISI